MNPASQVPPSLNRPWRSWRAAVVLVLAPLASPAEDRCTVSDWVIGVPDGPAKYVFGGGPIQLIPPQAKINAGVRTVERTVQGSSSADAMAVTASPPKSGVKPPPRPPAPQPKNDQERLFVAVYEGNLAEVERLLRSPAIDVNAPYRSDQRRSLIDVAAMRARPEIARALIEHGARVRGPLDAVDVQPVAVAMINLRSTVQMHGDPAAFTWDPERSPQDFESTLGVLLEAGADADGELDPTHPDSALGVLLTMPRFEGDMRIARLLIDHGAGLGASTPGGSPLAIAVEHGRDEFVDLVLEGRHVDPSALDAALAPAVARREAGIVAKLLAAGASPDARDPYGHSLFCATLMGGEPSRSLAMQFVQHGARPSVDCVGGPPLNLVMGDRELALLLLDRGADPSRADHNGATALNLAPDTDHALIDVLLAKGATLGRPISEQRLEGMLDAGGRPPGPTVQALLYHRDYLATGLLRRDGLRGDTPCAAVLYAAATGAHGTLAELLRRGADPNATTQRGITALMTAAYRNDVAALSLLLARPGIRVDRTTPTAFNPGTFLVYSENAQPLRTGHRTALMYAAAVGNPESCKLLIEHGADVRTHDAEGWSAMDYARTPEVRRELQAARGAP
jgi:ankyrin repeat protein